MKPTEDKKLLELAAKVNKKYERHGMCWTPEHQAWLGMKLNYKNFEVV